MGEKPRHRFDGALAQAFTLPEKPLLEGGCLDRKALEQLSLIERHSRRQGGRGAFAHQVFEPESVHLDARRLEADCVFDRPERLGLDRGQGLAKAVEGLTQVRLCLAIGAVAPEQGGQFVAGMRAARRTGQIAQKRPRLPGAEGDSRARFRTCDRQTPE